MNHIDLASSLSLTKTGFNKRVLSAAALMLIVGLSACSNKEKKPGQALASVNGEEVTVLQLNEELQRAGVQAAQQQAASKQLLEVLIDRQLLQNEALKEKMDRDPKVVQAVERAKSLIIAQTYLQKRIGTVARPTKAEIEDYFQKHPEFFTARKQFDMKELVIASKDLSAEVKAAMDAAKTLEEVVTWLEAHKVKFARTQISRTTADLAPELVSKLVSMPKGQLFIIKEGERSMLISIAEIKEAPVTLEVAAPQIDQFLFNKKSKDATDAELKRLRATAKIEYLNKTDKTGPGSAPAPVASAPAPASGAVAGSANAANERGVAGLK